ncbi:unnamed protein product, partial [Meganyctiphanes norvegica]
MVDAGVLVLESLALTVIMQQFIKRKLKYRVTEPRHDYTERYADGVAIGGCHVTFDPAVQRFMSMRATRFEHFKPTPKSSLLGFVMLVVPIVGYGWWMKTSRDDFEQKCRTGQIAYKDREFRFA